MRGKEAYFCLLLFGRVRDCLSSISPYLPLTLLALLGLELIQYK